MAQGTFKIRYAMLATATGDFARKNILGRGRWPRTPLANINGSMMPLPLHGLSTLQIYPDCTVATTFVAHNMLTANWLAGWPVAVSALCTTASSTVRRRLQSNSCNIWAQPPPSSNSKTRWAAVTNSRLMNDRYILILYYA